MSVYERATFRAVFAYAIEEWKKRGSGRTLARLAAAARVQPSYLSNALSGRAQLSADQAYAAARELGLADEETEYLLLALEHDRTGLADRRDRLAAQIRSIQRERLRTEKQLKARAPALSARELERYYLDPYNQIIHIYLHAKPGAAAADAGRALGIEPERAAASLETLRELGVASRKGKGYRAEGESRHLPKGSPVALAHLILLRVKALDRLQKLAPKDRYSFSATVAATPETRRRIEREFVRLLKQAEEWVEADAPTELFQINFDLFPWT